MTDPLSRARPRACSASEVCQPDSDNPLLLFLWGNGSAYMSQILTLCPRILSLIRLLYEKSEQILAVCGDELPFLVRQLPNPFTNNLEGHSVHLSTVRE